MTATTRRTVPIAGVVVKTEQRNPNRKPDCEFTYVDVSAVSSESLKIVDAARCLARTLLVEPEKSCE